MSKKGGLWDMFRRLSGDERIDREALAHAEAIGAIATTYGLRILENTPDRGARPWRLAELRLINETLGLLGPAFYSPFLPRPCDVWFDRTPGGGGYGNGTLRIGDPGHDPSLLYRVFLHEGTHASNEYRGWPYERQYCMRPGLDWRQQGSDWVHPRQQGRAPEPGNWETLPVDSRDVSVAPGEDLAEMVRYFVHSVRDERAYLWPLDQTKPPTYLWDTSPTRFIFVRDIFLALPDTHPWYRTLAPDVEARVAHVLHTG